MKNSSTITGVAPLHNVAHATGYSLRPLRSIISMLICIGCIATLIVVSSPVVLEAQTEWKDNYVTLAAEDQTNPSIARPSQTDYTIVVWEDQRDGGRDIYAQKIDNGNGLPQWTPVDGVAVCTASYNQTNPRAAYDSLGHVIIVWEDARGESSTSSVFAQCLDVSDGSANWQTNGIAVCDTSADAMQPRIVGVAEGAYIAWVDSRNKLDVADSTNRDIYLQYLYSQSGNWPTGTGVTWRSCGILVPGDTTGVHDETNVELARDYYWETAVDTKVKDGVVLVYESKRATSASGGADSIFVVFADSYNADGNWRWSSQDVRCATYNEAQLYPRVVVLGRWHGVGDSAAVIVWQDMRELATDNPRFDIYGQVIDKHTGSVLGTVSGEEVCIAQYTQRYPELSLYEEEEDPGMSIPYLARVICVYEDLRDYADQGVDVYCTVMNGTNMDIVTPAGNNGEEVCTMDDDQTQARVDNYPDDENSYIVWRHELDTLGGYIQSNIWYQSLGLRTLQFERTAGQGFAVTKAKGEQTTPQAGGDIFVYADYRRQAITHDNTYDGNIYAETPGECVGLKDMNWRDMFADVTTVGDAGHMRFVLDSAHNTFVVWEEPGEREGEQNVYIQKLDVDGVPRWENSGILLNTSTFASEPGVTISDSSGGAQVVWQQTTRGQDTVYYAKLSPMGAFTKVGVVGVGKKPVLDYTPVICGRGTTAYPAFIAAIDPDRKVMVWSWSGGGWSSRQSNQLAATPEDLLIRATMHGGCYIAAYAESISPFVEAIVLDSSCVFTQQGWSGDAVKGVDLDRDHYGYAAGTNSKDACIVYSLAPTGSTNTDLYSVHLDAFTSTIGVPHMLVNATMDEYTRSPAICANTSAYYGKGGFLLAWDMEFRPSGSQVHEVRSNQLTYDGTDWIIAHPSYITVSSWTTSYLLYPDIALIRNTTGKDDTTAFVVWEDIREACSPSRPREVVGNWVVYDSISAVRGPQWTNPKMIGPGGGNYTQLRPMVKTSKDSTVNVFWYDGRGAKDLVMGTRTWAVNADNIDWAKRRMEAPPVPDLTIRLGENYPNPLSLQRSQVSHIVVEAAMERSIHLSLYDNLGRQIAVVHDGQIAAGRQILRFNTAGLSPGMYHYVLRADESMTSRGLIIVR